MEGFLEEVTLTSRSVGKWEVNQARSTCKGMRLEPEEQAGAHVALRRERKWGRVGQNEVRKVGGDRLMQRGPLQDRWAAAGDLTPTPSFRWLMFTEYLTELPALNKPKGKENVSTAVLGLTV